MDPMKKGTGSSSYVAFVLECSINDRVGLDAVMRELVASTEANEPGTDIYEWSIFEDGATLITYERFADSEAALAHHAGFGPYAERFLSAVTVTRFVVFGSPDEALRDALKDAGVSYVSQNRWVPALGRGLCAEAQTHPDQRRHRRGRCAPRLKRSGFRGDSDRRVQAAVATC